MLNTEPRRFQTALITLTVALAGGLLGTALISSIMSELARGVLIVGCCTAALSAAAAWLTHRLSKTGSGAAALGFALTLLASIFNAPLSYFFVALLAPVSFVSANDVPAGCFAAAIFGLIFTIPLGVFFGSLFAPLLALTNRFVRDTSREAVELTIRLCGGWLGGVGLLGAGASSWLFGLSRLPDALPGALFALSLATAALGFAAALVAHLLVTSRRRWLRRILSTTSPEWAVVSAETLGGETAGLQRFFLSSDNAPTSVLVRPTSGVAAGAYRTGERLEPVALL